MSPSQIIDALKKHMNVTNGPLAKVTSGMSPSQIIDALKKHMNVTNGPLAKKLHELLNMSSQTDITRLPASPSAASLSPEEEQQLLKQLQKIMKDHPGILNYTNSSGDQILKRIANLPLSNLSVVAKALLWWTRRETFQDHGSSEPDKVTSGMSPSQIIDALKKHMNVTNGPLAKKLHELLNMSSQTDITRLPASPSAASLSPEEEQQLLKQLQKIMKDHPGILNYTNSSGRPDSSQTRQFAAQQPFSCREKLCLVDKDR
ncbi:hypothetical protein OSTOST_08443 [Ostertagia ostertagi]